MESPALAVMWAASRMAEAELEVKEEAVGRRREASNSSIDEDAVSTGN